MFSQLSELISRFHPVIVHLPIGILLTGALFLWLSGKERFQGLKAALPLTWLLGAASAAAACITGWLLASGGDYDAGIAGRHRWLGIGVAVVASAGYWFLRRPEGLEKTPRIRLLLAAGTTILLTLTGHLGGTLTHGEGYLTQPLKREEASKAPSFTNIQEAAAYQDLIRPVLESKCYTCHSERKEKGGLRVDSPDWLLKGGKDGKVLIAGNAAGSELYHRLTLDIFEEDHMPPKGKPQLSEAEIALIQWWIDAGAGFEKRVKELPQPDAVKAVLTAYEAQHAKPVSDPDIPTAEVSEAKAPDIEALRGAGVLILPVAANSNYLLANFINARDADDADLKLLLPIADQLIWLKLGGTRITDAGLETIGQLTRLTRLSLEHTSVTDAGLETLNSLSGLRYLNLVGTAVTDAGLKKLKPLKKLKTVYLFQSKVPGNAWPELQKALPGVVLDSGGYMLPLLEGDTSLVKPRQ